MINFEGGAIPEEYQTAYIVDRVNTTSTVWLGLTVACSQCHDHKYDPITQKEFYRLYAFFNNVPENGLDGRTGNSPPLLKAPDARASRKLDELAAAIVAGWNSNWPAICRRSTPRRPPGRPSRPRTPAVAWRTALAESVASAGGATLAKAGRRRDPGHWRQPGDRHVHLRPTETRRRSRPSGSKPWPTIACPPRARPLAQRQYRADSMSRWPRLPRPTESAERRNRQTVKLATAWADFSQDQFPRRSARSTSSQRPAGPSCPRPASRTSAVFQREQPLAGRGGAARCR